MALFGLIAVGCVEKVKEDDTTAPESTGTTAETTGTGTETVDPTESTAASATDTDTTSASATDTASGSATDTDTGGMVPAECMAFDPEVSAALSVTVVDWPEATNDDHDIDVMCTVDAVAVEGETVVTALTCDDAGMPRQASLRIAVSPVGSVMWFAGDSVRLQSYRLLEVDFGFDTRSVKLTAADETPLMIGHQGGSEGIADNWAKPVTTMPQFPCGEEDVDGQAGLPYQLLFGFGENSVAIMHGHRGVLPFDATQVLAIDVGKALTNFCCHYTREYDVLIRRVMPL